MSIIDKANTLATAVKGYGQAVEAETDQLAGGTVGAKEPAITAGTTAQFWRGDKTWQNFASNVRATVLTGLVKTNSAILATDNVLAALGKSQGQYESHVGDTNNPHSVTKAQVGLGSVDNTSDADKPISTATQTALNGKEATIVLGTTAQYYRGDKTWQTLNKAAVGLGNVDNTSDANKPVSTAQQTALNGKVDKTSIGVANGVAGLDANGKVPATQLPSFVDDILEYNASTDFPATGETGKIYVAINGATAASPTRQYRWSGSAYAEINPSPGTTDALTEGTTNLYFTAARVRAVVLTGLSLATNAAIAATDTVLSALGKLQKQITDLTTTVNGKEGSIAAGTTAQYWRGDKTWQAMPTNLNQFTNGPGYLTSGGTIDWASALASQGNVTMETGATRGPDGLRIRHVYNNGYPITYGTVLHVGAGGGQSQLLLGWSGGSTTTVGHHVDNFIRNKRDVDGTIWSDWAKILTSANMGDVAAGTGSLDLIQHIGGMSGVRFKQTSGFLRDDGTTHAFKREGATNADLWWCDNAGVFITKGDLGSDSDEKLKTNWRDVDGDALIAGLAKVLHGVYDRIDVQLTQLGVGAGSLSQVPGMEHAVGERDGIKNVAYGQAALVAAVKLSIRAEQQREVIQQQTQFITEMMIQMKQLQERMTLLENK